MKSHDTTDTSCTQTVGAVMVVGGGIGGIQSALDLANSGFRVYMVEEQSAIGGTMAQLDKTFPTNDCSMCIISPKLVEVGRHLNIDIYSYAEIQRVEGSAGNFQVEIVQKPRFVDLDKCTGCGDCSKVCPVEIASEFDAGLVSRAAIYKRYPQAIPNAFAIDKAGIAPCKDACPAGIHVQGYVALISKGKFREALELIRQHNPLPSVCGRVCTHPCETACTRGTADDPLAVMHLKRFVSDWEQAANASPAAPAVASRDEKVAIVGGGPSGLSAAFYLAREGYGVTVFEAASEPGGMLLWGIPDYRLPRSILRNDIDYIKKSGVEIITDTPIGKKLPLDDLVNKHGFNAVYLATGAQQSMKLGVEGEDLQGVIGGLDYLRSINAGTNISLGKRVAVVGGGNVAIDVVRTALRMGSEEVTILYRRSREEMPALDEEIDDALEEGAAIRYLAAPKQIIGSNGAVTGIECLQMELGEADASGRRRPVPISGSEFVLNVDAVIPAIGQIVDLSFLNDTESPTAGARGTINADALTLQTSIPGVFAGGDMVTGPATVVEAIGQGHEAAISIARYLQKVDLRTGREKKLPVAKAETDGVQKDPRRHPARLSSAERIADFSEVQLGYTEEAAVAEASRCLSCGICSECLQCVDACMARAINHDACAQNLTLQVGSIVLAPGFELTDPALREEYGYNRYDNVITSLEFERILSASGPYQGHIKRPSDESTPARIAWIQCVGSRDVSCGKGYCSSVCCMYATKEAIIAREHDAGVKPTIFYMDIRAHGKGFDKYYERARHDHGVRYVQCQISKIVEKPSSKNLIIAYVDGTGSVIEEEFDLVVLSVGMSPSKSSHTLAKRLGIELNTYGFCRTASLNHVSTSRPGIYVCGAFAAPKDIPETVTQASSAAASASGILSETRGTLVRTAEFPAERNIDSEDPRIGVFVCHCGINIGGVVNVPDVKDYAGRLPGVVYVDDNLYTCSQDTQSKMKEIVREQQLNRVVVASCSPRTHEPLFQETIREAGLNRYLFEMANIRDQCSWVHMNKKDEATAKAKDLVRMAVAACAFTKPLYEQELGIHKRALVVGGGASGMSAALGMADQGFSVVLLEREKELGGNLNRLHYTIEKDDVQSFRRQLIERVSNHQLIQVVCDSIIVDFDGFKGNFKTGIISGPSMAHRTIEHGITIIATGGTEHKPQEYLYGQDERVMTQQEFESSLASGSINCSSAGDVVMIQCVGSRNQERPYCSRVCCASAIKNAIALKEKNPDINVYILYRDIRTYGFLEDYYHRARTLGVIFIRFDNDTPPSVANDGGPLKVSVYDQSIQDTVVLFPRYLVLSSAVVPHINDELSTLLKLQRTPENFFLEAHMKLRPVDLATEGIFVCGLAHAPKPLGESLSQAAAAVSRACTLLSHDTISVGGMVAHIDDEKCAACLTCVRVCPFDVPFINDDGAAQIDAALCQGCGSCASECPGKAIQLGHSEDRQIISKTVALFKGDF